MAFVKSGVFCFWTMSVTESLNEHGLVCRSVTILAMNSDLAQNNSGVYAYLLHIPSKTAGKATHALHCSWISMTAWWQHVCLCQERCNYIICGTLPRRLKFEGTAAFLDLHDSLVAAWLSLTGALHGCVCDRTAAYLLRRRILESKNREEGNGKPPRLFSLDVIPIDGCFKDVLQLLPLFFVVDCRLPSDGSH